LQQATSFSFLFFFFHLLGDRPGEMKEKLFTSFFFPAPVPVGALATQDLVRQAVTTSFLPLRENASPP